MTFAESTLRAQRWLVLTMLVGSAVIILPSAVEPFMLPKATFLVVLGVALAGLAAARALWVREVRLPLSPVTGAVAAFGLALVVATVTSPTPLVSLVGVYSRYTGLIAYLTYLLVFIAILRLASGSFFDAVRRAALIALGLVVGYGLVQAAGLDPVDYRDLRLGTTFSFLGNVDFSAAWAGATSGLALTTALMPGERRAWRVYGAVLVPLALLYVVLTGTSQGPVVAAVSVGWAALLFATASDGRVRRAVSGRRGIALAVAGVAAAVAGVALVAALPYLQAQLEQAFVERPEFWAAGIRIFTDHPLIGSGLDTYGHHFLSYRPASHALANGTAGTDAPHSVPLGMFSNGGVVLGLTYLAVVALVGFALVKGALRTQGPSRLVLAGFGGVWLGYQAQSLISFDVPPLAFLHWLSAAVIVAIAWPPQWRSVALPGAAAARPVNKKGKAHGGIVVPVSTRVLLGALGVVGLAALWIAVLPLRADLTAASAAPLTSAGRFDDASARFQRAADLNPAEGSYAFLVARAEDAAGRHDRALAAAAEAARRDPGTVEYALFAAKQAQQAGQGDAAAQWYRVAAERDPRDPPVLNEAAGFLGEAGDLRAAEALLERSAQLRPEPETLVLLGRAKAAMNDVAGAREVLERALALEPGNADAQAVLDKLQAA
jgi:tetratricopeptide (TPR) repeat protein